MIACPRWPQIGWSSRERSSAMARAIAPRWLTRLRRSLEDLSGDAMNRAGVLATEVVGDRRVVVDVAEGFVGAGHDPHAVDQEVRDVGDPRVESRR